MSDWVGAMVGHRIRSRRARPTGLGFARYLSIPSFLPRSFPFVTVTIAISVSFFARHNRLDNNLGGVKGPIYKPICELSDRCAFASHPR
jgi:hypothetical protein